MNTDSPLPLDLSSQRYLLPLKQTLLDQSRKQRFAARSQSYDQHQFQLARQIHSQTEDQAQLVEMSMNPFGNINNHQYSIQFPALNKTLDISIVNSSNRFDQHPIVVHRPSKLSQDQTFYNSSTNKIVEKTIVGLSAPELTLILLEGNTVHSPEISVVTVGGPRLQTNVRLC
jgi:hypothetical protein